MKLNLGTLTISSPAFGHGERIPDASAGFEGRSPELTWSGVPEGTESFVLIAHDPDAPLINGFTHWVVYGISPDTDHLDEDAAGVDSGGAFVNGNNSMDQPGYVGAAPPPGHDTHYYYFELYALNTDLGLPPGLSRHEVLDRIDDAVIEQARVVGTYSN